MYYLVKVKFDTINERTGRPMSMYELWLVEAIDISDVEQKIKLQFKDSIADFMVVSVQESKIRGVIQQPRVVY
jgi:hypothetical protein